MKIALGIVVHRNAYIYREAFIESINGQTYRDFEVIIINDGLTEKMVEFYKNNIKNVCHVIESSSPFSIPANRVQLIQESINMGVNYLIFGDADDCFANNRIDRLVSEYDGYSGFYYNDLVYETNFEKVFPYFPDQVNSIGLIAEENFLGLSNTAVDLSVFNLSILEILRGLEVDVFDWFLYSVLVMEGGKGKYVRGTYTIYNIHDNNIVGKQVCSERLIQREIDLKLTLYKHLSRYYKIYKELYWSYKIIADKPFYYFFGKPKYWWGYLKVEAYARRQNLVQIKNRIIKNYSKPYIIAEIGSNHNGDMELAKRIIDEAVKVGVDAVKFQSWDNKSLIAREEYENNQSYDDSPKKHFGSLEEMVEKYYLRREQHYLLKEYCEQKGVEFCSTPFSIEEVDLLEDVGVPFYKVASMDINNYRLLTHIARKRKPIILSTGMATFSEIEAAVDLIENEGNDQIILLHCISIYPPNPKDINLKNILMLQEMYPQYAVGFSDHTIGTSVPIASVALGAALIEKHFTVDKELPGWDHEVSANPDEMKYIVDESAVVSRSLGKYRRTVSKAEKEKMQKFRRSIVLTRDMKKGEKITGDDIAFKRPGTGISPNMENFVIGRVLKTDKKFDDILTYDDF